MGRNGASKSSRNFVCRGRAAFYPTFSSGTYSLSANGLNTLNPRLAGLSDQFQLYRYRKLRFGFSEGSWGSAISAGKFSTGYAAGVYLEIPDTLPSTDHTKLMEEPYSMFMSGSWAAASGATPTGYQGPLQAGYPNEHISVPAKHLLGDAPYKWWRTRPSGGTTTDLWQVCQWFLYVVAEDTTLGSGLQATIWVDYEIEFSDPVDPSQTPAPSATQLDRLLAKASLGELNDLLTKVIDARGKKATTRTGDDLAESGN